MIKNRKGFTLVELLATIVILSIVVGLSIVGINISIENTKKKTEDVFVKTLRDATRIYIDSDGRKLSFNTTEVCTINKTHKTGVKIYKSSNSLTFNSVLTSSYVPLVESEYVNPANKDVKCNKNAPLNIYRDDDYVYYYKIIGSELNCLRNDYNSVITDLPSGCNG